MSKFLWFSGLLTLLILTMVAVAFAVVPTAPTNSAMIISANSTGLATNETEAAINGQSIAVGGENTFLDNISAIGHQAETKAPDGATNYCLNTPALKGERKTYIYPISPLPATPWRRPAATWSMPTPVRFDMMALQPILTGGTIRS